MKQYELEAMVEKDIKPKMLSAGFKVFESYMNGEIGWSFIDLKTGECMSIRLEGLDEDVLETYREMNKE